MKVVVGAVRLAIRTFFYTTALLRRMRQIRSGFINVLADVIPSANGPRLRSYSMNGQMGAVYAKQAGFNDDAPAMQYVKDVDIIRPDPSSAFVFCDENPGTINDRFWKLTPTEALSRMCRAMHSAGACGLSFADGHLNSQMGDLGPHASRDSWASAFEPQVPGGKSNADWVWLAQHSASDP